MKTWHTSPLILALLVATLLAAAQTPSTGEPVPKYEKSTEGVFKGTVEDVPDRQCPACGGMGSHLMLR